MVLKLTLKKFMLSQIYLSQLTKTELQKFFGMLNYLEKFIPNLSIKSANLRKLLEKDKEFVFDPPQIDAFNKLEQLVANM